MKEVESFLEKLMFGSRWIMAPVYLGLVVCLVFLLYVFIHEIIIFIPLVTSAGEAKLILFILNLIDLSLAGNLLLMVIFSGYENFISKIDVGNHKDKPSWMGKVNFSNLKLKLISSIVAISGIHLLKVFMSLDDYTREQIFLYIFVHLTFVGSGVLLALMDYLIGKTSNHS
mgnify:FL=1|tara:strand:- start:925 stop:1437 length:513 start_codon:yes stop_codon:yes gene_type:complete